ncbi:MAG: histidine kinase [Pseudomonadota bacterium]
MWFPLKDDLIRVLLVDSSDDDAQALVDHLAAAGMKLEWRRVDSLVGLRAALGESLWDVVIAEHHVADFDAMAVLRIVHGIMPHMPFLIVSGHIGEEDAAEAMNAGAFDYVLKSNLLRLAPAIRRALGKAQLQAERTAALRRLREREAQLSAITQHIPGAVFRMSFDTDGRLSFAYVSEGVRQLLFVSPQTLLADASPFIGLLNLNEKAGLFGEVRRCQREGGVLNWTGRLHLPPDEEVKWINIRATVDRHDEREVVLDGVMLNVTATKLGEQALSQSRAQMQALAARLQEAREEERRRIAHEVHDELGSSLTALKMDLYLLRRRLEEQAAGAEVLEQLAGLRRAVDQTIGTVRSIAQDLRPKLLDELGLIPALQSHIEECGRRTGIRCLFDGDCEDVPLDERVATAAFRIVQEALTNVLRHSGASEVRVEIRCADGCLLGSVCDNGRGIAAGRLEDPLSTGVRGMQERARLVGGQVRVSSGAQGTCVRVDIPFAGWEASER